MTAYHCVVCGNRDNPYPDRYKCRPCEAQYPTYPMPGTCIRCGIPVDLGVSPLCSDCALADEEDRDAHREHQERRHAAQRGVL